jgi:ATP-dependent DNA helicase PIF1
MATRLCTHKENVDLINQDELAKLKGISKTFEATDSSNMPSTQCDNLFPVKGHLELKVGAQVRRLLVLSSYWKTKRSVATR